MNMDNDWTPSSGIPFAGRKGRDLSPSIREAHLYCNFTRSYINCLLAELAEQA